MIDIKNEKECCGCGACSVVCPTQCITMLEGTLGHLFPFADSTKCIGCSACDRVCPMLNEEFSTKDLKQSAYAAYAKNKSEKLSGSSGGMFGVFARYLLHDGYIIYGSAFDSDMQLKCFGANNIEELRSLYKSKYLQSDLTGKYREIKKKLKGGEKVLFVSTPVSSQGTQVVFKI